MILRSGDKLKTLQSKYSAKALFKFTHIPIHAPNPDLPNILLLGRYWANNFEAEAQNHYPKPLESEYVYMGFIYSAFEYDIC